MSHSLLVPRATSLLLAVGGPVALGAVLGMRFGTWAVIREALLLPTLLFGLTLFMVPALYIGLSLVGSAPPASDVVVAAGRGLRACGTLLVGLAPATAFLLATAEAGPLAYVLGTAALAAGVAVGLRGMFTGLVLTTPAPLRAGALFFAWTIVSVGLGAHLFLTTLVPQPV